MATEGPKRAGADDTTEPARPDAQAKASSLALVGRVINGRFRLMEVLGEGGMGTVYGAQVLTEVDQQRIGLRAALKFLKVDLLRDEATARRRLLRESQVGEELRHPGVVRVFGLETSDHDQRTPFLVMERLEGETLLAQLLRNEQGIDWREAATIVRKVIPPLAEAHGRKLVHRDLKPANIFVCGDGGVKLLDFGVAWLKEERLTRTGQIIGTPHFISPEQLSSVREIDERADVYGLGAVLFSCLTGRPPIQAESALEALAELKERDQPGSHAIEVKRWAPHVPDEVAQLVCRAIAFRREDRYPTVQALGEALGEALAIDPIIGRTVMGGDYRVEKRLGHGGMGSVYLLQHASLPKRLALKVLGGGGSGASAEMAKRFQQEALAAASIPSSHVCQPITVGKFADGQHYIVMEYVEGPSLAEVLDKNGPLPVADAVTIVVLVAEALKKGHQLQIIHRDVKPQNIMLVRWGSTNPKIVDFGVARAQGGQKFVVTHERAVIGTPGYMSPEAIAGTSTDTRSDVFSLGVVLFELLAGRLPFAAPDAQRAMINVLTDRLPSVSALRPAHLDPVPPALERALARALEKDPKNRFTMAEFEAALLGGDGVVEAPLKADLSAAVSDYQPHEAPTLSHDSGTVAKLVHRLTPQQLPTRAIPIGAAPASSRRWSVVIGALTLTAFACAGIVWSLGHRAPPAAHTAASEPATPPKATPAPPPEAAAPPVERQPAAAEVAAPAGSKPSRHHAKRAVPSSPAAAPSAKRAKTDDSTFNPFSE